MIRPAFLAAGASVAIVSAVAAAAVTVVTTGGDNNNDDARVTCEADARAVRVDDDTYSLVCPTQTAAPRATSDASSGVSATPTAPPTPVSSQAPFARAAGSSLQPASSESAAPGAAPAGAAPAGAPAAPGAPPTGGQPAGGAPDPSSSGGGGGGGAPAPAPTPSAPQPTVAVPVPTPTRPAAATNLPQPNNGNFCNDSVPMGGVEPQRPEWCFLPQSPAVTTHANGGNSWTDDWQHGVSHARLGNVGDGYVAGGTHENCGVLHFRHNQHWMVDIAGDGGQHPALCAAWLRPDRSFRLQNGRLVVEMEVAGPIAGTRSDDGIGDSWPELVISTASRPTRASENSWGSPLRKSGTYLYEAFPRAWTFGCRMQQSRHPICALYNNGESFAGSADRIWEINQNGGDVRFEEGGDPATGVGGAWKSCNSADDPDTVCRNKFRFEFYKDATGNYVMDIYSNSSLYYRAGLVDAALDNIFGGAFYVYFGEFAYRIDSGKVLRFHWDHIAVNP